MTESEWQACADPRPMLEFLKGRMSDRKLRLFACACCRRIWHLLSNKGIRDTIEIAERFADGLVRDEERSDACKMAQQAAQSRAVTRRPVSPKWERRAASMVYYASARDAMEAAYNAPQFAIEVLIWRVGGYEACDSKTISQGEYSLQADDLRDIFGNPFCPAAVDPHWLAWNNATIAKLARVIYDERAFDHLLILADALEEAGCGNADILSHCRQPGEHVRGCWVVDLILGKE
jgi:hypothetical protein